MRRQTAQRWLLGLYCAFAAARAIAGVSVWTEVGRGQSVEIVGLGVAGTELYAWRLPANTELRLSVLGRIARWHGTEANAVVSHLWDLSATPVVTLQPAKPEKWFPYLDVGVGVHAISETRINAYRQFSTIFQFGELLGAGLRFGEHAQYDVALCVQHVSNGDIKEPNNGLTFRAIVFQYHF
jgi:lipid A 3-O-deacylase